MNGEGRELLEALEAVLRGQVLTEDQARSAFEAIMDGLVPPSRLAGFLVGLRMRGETAGELAAFARVMRERATRVRSDRPILLDTCGTGGDRAGTFNISTLSALVAAGAGVAVAKHGNRSVSSRCGSADLLEALGVQVDSPVPLVERSLREAGIGFLFAPALHGAMRHALPVRRELGVRTVFNLLGPLTNPAGARHHLLGVFDPAWAETLARALQELGSERAMVVHGSGLDEIALHAETYVAELHQGTVRTYSLAPEDAGLRRAPLEEVTGGGPEQNAAIASEVLGGRPGARRDIVVLNAAAALVIAGVAGDLREGAVVAARAIDSGAAGRVLERLRAIAPKREGSE
jgi:anthranilate phosphoribosyltransferase